MKERRYCPAMDKRSSFSEFHFKDGVLGRERRGKGSPLRTPEVPNGTYESSAKRGFGESRSSIRRNPNCISSRIISDFNSSIPPEPEVVRNSLSRVLTWPSAAEDKLWMKQGTHRIF